MRSLTTSCSKYFYRNENFRRAHVYKTFIFIIHNGRTHETGITEHYGGIFPVYPVNVFIELSPGILNFFYLNPIKAMCESWKEAVVKPLLIDPYGFSRDKEEGACLQTVSL